MKITIRPAQTVDQTLLWDEVVKRPGIYKYVSGSGSVRILITANCRQVFVDLAGGGDIIDIPKDNNWHRERFIQTNEQIVIG